MRQFQDKIFFGHGEYSAKLLARLKASLERGAVLLHNTQWPCRASPKFEPKEKNEQEIEDIVRDIAMALTGKEIEFKGK